MTRTHEATALLLAVLTATAGIPLAAVAVPGAAGGAGSTGTVAAQTGPTAACEVSEKFPEPGEPVQLDATDTVNATLVEFDSEGNGTFELDDDDGDFVGETTYTAGTYEPRVRATDLFPTRTDTADCGTIVVAENTPPNVSFDVATPPLVAGDPEELVANTTDDDGTIEAYEWRVDGELLGDDDLLDIEFAEPDEYVVNLTVTDDDGDSASAVRTVEALPSEPPQAALTANRTVVDEGDAVRFDAANATDDGAVVAYDWDVDGDGTVDRRTDVAEVVHEYASVPGDSWTATVTVVDDDGLNDTAGVDLEPANRPPTVEIAVPPEPPVVGEPVRFEAEASDPDGEVTSHEWAVDDEEVATGPVLEYTFDTEGDYEVRLTVTDDDGASATTALSLTVEELSRPPVARIDTNRTIVSGDSSGVAFDATNSTDPDGSITFYEWDFDDDGSTDVAGPSPFFGEVTHAFARPAANSTTQRVRLIVTDDNGTTDTATTLITVTADGNRPPTAAFSQSPTLPVRGTNVTLNATASSDPDGTIASYAWDLDGDGSPEATGPTVTRNVSRIPGNATLTVTDGEGATATVSKRVTRFTVQNQSGTVTVDGTTTYVNSPPKARFTAPPRPEPGDRLTFESESFDLDGGIVDQTWYVNGSVEGGGVLFHLPEPGLFAGGVEAGTYNVTLVVTDRAGDTSRETKVVTVRDRRDDPANVDFIFRGRGEGSPGKIVVGEPVEFRGSAQVEPGRSIRSFEWTFVGGEEISLSGGSVVNSFEFEGSLPVMLRVTDSAGESSRVTRTIEVEPRDEVPKITDVTPDKRGATLQDAPISNTYTATVEAGDAIDRVEFELAGRTKVDRSGGDGWSGQFDLERLNDDATLTVTAVDADGDRDTTTRNVEVVRTPGWVDGLLDRGSVSVERNPTRIVATRTVPEPPIDISLDLSGILPFKFGVFEYEIRGEGGIEYVMSSRTADIEGGGLYRIKLGGVQAKDQITGDGTVEIDRNENWRLRNLRLSAGIKGCCWRPGFRKKVSISAGPLEATAKVTAELKLGRGGALTIELGRRNGILAPTGGQIALSYLGGGSASATGALTYKGRGVEASVSANVKRVELKGAIDIDTMPIRLRPSGRIEIVVRVSAGGKIKIPLVGDKRVSVGKTFRWSGQLGSADIGHGTLALRDAEVESTGEATVRPLPARLGHPPADDADPATTLALEGRPQSVVDAARLTDDDRWDGPPALAAGNGTYTAVWSRQDPGSDAGGVDVYAATATDGRWSGPAPIVEENATAVDPDVAADGDVRAAAWTRVPVPSNDTTLEARLRNASLGFAVNDGSGWRSLGPVEDGNESDPVVAVDNGTVLLAWTRDPDGNVSTTADRQVRWATLNGPADDARTIPNATAVDVAGGPDGFTLAYLESDDGTNGTVVRADLVNGRLVEAGRHRARNVTGLAAGPRAVAWTAFPGNRTVLRYAGGNGIETVPTANVLGVANVELLEDAGRPVLVYSGLPLRGSADGVFTQRRAATGWLPPRRLASAGEGNLSVSGVGAAAGEDDLAAVFSLENASGQGFPDVFAARRSFAPDLAIAASTAEDVDDATAGDRVTMNYTVRNVGSRATATGTSVALETVSGTAASRTHGPLAPGERAAGSVTVVVGTGPRLRVDPGDAVAEINESNNAVSVAVARPDLTVANVTQRGDGEDVVVEAEIRNRGPVPVANATVALRSGNATLAGKDVDVPGSGIRRVRLRVQRDAVNRSLEDAVVVDPGEAIAESDERNNAAGLRLLAVDLGLSGTVRTADAPGGVLADTFVANAGPGQARAEITVSGRDAELTYGLRISGPDGDGRTFRQVRLYHPATNGTLDLSVDPRQGVDTNGFDNVARTTVNASANDTAPVRVAGVDAGPADGDGATTIVVVLATDADVATGVPVTVSAGGTTVAERTAVVPANDTNRIELTADVGDATTLSAATPGSEATLSLAAAPDVNGNGQPATDPDGDGLFEDVDGDGTFSIVDVAVLLDRFDRSPVQNNPALFDFDGSGGVNIVDVAELLDET